MSDLVIRRTGTDVPAAIDEQIRLAEVLARSDLLPRHLRGNTANVLLILQAARALNVTAFWALQSIVVIDGRMTLSAELIRALIIREGHEFRVLESTDEKAVVRIKRKDRDEPYVTEWTIEDARAAGLLNKTNWRNYRKAMLVARATTKAAREECPDVLFGHVYTPEELGALVDADGNPILDRDGRPIIEGEVVEPPAPEEVAAWAQQIRETEHPAGLAALWQEITTRGGGRAEAEPGVTLTAVLTERILDYARKAATRQEIRELWALARDTLKITEVGLYDELKRLGNALPDDRPEERPAEPAEKPAQEDAGAPNTPNPGERVGAAPKTATAHAEGLQRAARESWGDTDPGPGGDAGDVIEGEILP